jgi:hypothetical protein
LWPELLRNQQEAFVISLVSIGMLLRVLVRIAMRRSRSRGDAPPVAPIQDLLDYLVRPTCALGAIAGAPTGGPDDGGPAWWVPRLQMVVLVVVDLMFYMPDLVFPMDYKVSGRTLGAVGAQALSLSDPSRPGRPQAPPLHSYFLTGGQDKVFMIYFGLREVSRAGAGADGR